MTLPTFKMPSLTDWMEKINFPHLLEFRNEDNLKFSRLEKLKQIIGINYNKPEILSIDDFFNNSKKIEDLKNNRKIKKCNIRLIPKTPIFPKQRLRATTFRDGIKWLKNLKFEAKNYERIEIVPYNEEVIGSGIFLINDKGIWGEALDGDLWQLTFGMHQHEPNIFTFNFNKWQFSKSNQITIEIIKSAIKLLKIEGRSNREKIEEELNGDINSAGYLKGYFEFIVWPKEGILFLDYNRIIPTLADQHSFNINESNKIEIQGRCASPGMAHGRAKIILNPREVNDFKTNDILVCKNITLDYVPLMKKAAAILVEQGNILSHATIVSRELNKPCLVLVKNITTKLKDNDDIFVDANAGSVTIMK